MKPSAESPYFHLLKTPLCTPRVNGRKERVSAIERKKRKRKKGKKGAVIVRFRLRRSLLMEVVVSLMQKRKKSSKKRKGKRGREEKPSIIRAPSLFLKRVESSSYSVRERESECNRRRKEGKGKPRRSQWLLSIRVILSFHQTVL